MTIDTSAGDATVLGRRTPAAEMSRSAIVFRWVTGTLGFVLLFALIILIPPSINFRYLLLFTAAMAAADYFFLVRVGPGSYFSISHAFLFAYFLNGGGLAAAIAGCVSRALVWYLLLLRSKSKQTPLYQFFSLGEFVLSVLAATLAASLVTTASAFAHPVIRKPITSLIVFALTYLVAHAVISTFAAWSRAGLAEVRSQLWPSDTKWTAISVLTSVPFAAVIIFSRFAIGYTAATVLMFLVLGGIAVIIRLNVELRTGNDELKALNRIGSLINATLDVSELFKIIARESRRVLPWDGFFIATSDRTSNDIQIVFMTGGGTEVAQRTIPRGAGLTGRAIETGEMIHYESRDSERSDEADQETRGDRKPKSIVVAPMKFGEEIIGAISVQSFRADVYGASQLRLLQTIAGQAAIAIRNAQLFQSEERANIERDEFLSLVTHEIKNPLASVRGYTDLAEASLQSGEVEGAIESLAVIRSEARRILRLTEDLLDASKMSAGKFALSLQKVNPRETVVKVTTRYRRLTPQPIELRLDENVPEIEADELRLTQVLENLMSNAVKYSEKHGPIEVELRAAPSSLRLSVRDHGAGISPEKLPRLFERYYRVQEGGQTVKGTGLGLFISREIIRMHGGTISVSSTVGQGTTFIIELPLPGNG